MELDAVEKKGRKRIRRDTEQNDEKTIMLEVIQTLHGTNDGMIDLQTKKQANTDHSEPDKENQAITETSQKRIQQFGAENTSIAVWPRSTFRPQKKVYLQGRHSFYGIDPSKGELFELREDLRSKDLSKQSEAVKKIIALMTVGKDVSMLFPDVVNCIQTKSLELKKLVYLYLINYSKSQPDLAIMAVNTFVKDAENDNNPLIRALAVRTMGCIRVEKITEYLAQPLKKALKDEHPYVRKTAAICVAKLFEINPEMVVDKGFIEILRDMLTDSTPMVVANAVAALSEIQSVSSEKIFDITPQTSTKLLSALNECTEWGQVFILDGFVRYKPRSASEASDIVDRVVPRFQHANSAVVLSSIKVVLKSLRVIKDGERIKEILKKMTQPLEPEIQYVALRNIELIIERYPSVLQGEMRVFFCKYNDPVYVKMEKLEILLKLANSRNFEHLLLELKEYATEVDVEFVRQAVSAIGRLAIKIDKVAKHCVQALVELIDTGINYIVQEAISVLKDIFRKYPNQYESIIGNLCENLESLDEPAAKASMIWIIGEYADRIENADELLEIFLEKYIDESSEVQMQLLTASVKLFLTDPANYQSLVQKVLSLVTQTADHPDLRDRAYVYWRLLTEDLDKVKEIVVGERPTISEGGRSFSDEFLTRLLEEISTLSSIYQKLPEFFVAKVQAPEILDDREKQAQTMKDSFKDSVQKGPTRLQTAVEAAAASQSVDLLDISSGSAQQPSKAYEKPNEAANLDSLLDVFGGGVQQETKPEVPDPVERSQPLLLGAEKGKGLEIYGSWAKRSQVLYFDITLLNKTNEALDKFAVQFKQNVFGVRPGGPLAVSEPLQPGDSILVALPINFQESTTEKDANILVISIAIKFQMGVVYFKSEIPARLVFKENAQLDKQGFLSAWKDVPDSLEKNFMFNGLRFSNLDGFVEATEKEHIYLVGRRKSDNKEFAYMFIIVDDYSSTKILLEIANERGATGVFTASVRCSKSGYLPIFENNMNRFF